MKGTLLFLLGISLFLGFVLGGALVSNIFPSTLRISAPLVCQGEMTVVSRQYSYKPGSVSVEHKVYCQDETGGAKRDITFLAVMVSCLIYSGIIFLLFCANLLVKRLRGEQLESPQPPPTPSFPQPLPMPVSGTELGGEDPAGLLKKLKELRQADLITEQEYEAKKAEILSKI